MQKKLNDLLEEYGLRDMNTNEAPTFYEHEAAAAYVNGFSACLELAKLMIEKEFYERSN